MNYSKSATHVCVGCEGIRSRGGGQWLPGETHYVGCPTELAELRREIKRLQEQVNHADGTWAGLRAKLALRAFRSVDDVHEYTMSPKTYQGR